MEIRSTTYSKMMLVRFVACFLLLLSFQVLMAQPPVRSYTIRNGKMYITIDKQISDAALDSFVTRYDLSDLDLKSLIKQNITDTLKKQGWKVESGDDDVFILSKSLEIFDKMGDPADKIVFTQRLTDLAGLFPAISDEVQYGYNRFRNKKPFAVRDSVVSFYLRGNLNANNVILSGSFNNWSPDALPMKKTDSGWIADLSLPVAGKYWYKFLVDGKWILDADNFTVENDGQGNNNSVYYKTNIVFTLQGYRDAKKVYLSGRFNKWRPAELQMTRAENGWQIPLYLADGTHTYRFVADGKWFADPGNADKLPNEFGEFNSVIRLGKPYLFRLDGFPLAKKVMLQGSFNDWRENELFMKKTANGWELPYTLGPGNYEYKIKVDDDWLGDSLTQGNIVLVLQPNFTFRLKGYENAKRVFVAGDFNQWNTGSYAMKKEGDEWVMAVHFSPGKHRYKFIVDGKWILDPANKLWEQNEYNTGNSIVWTDR